MSVLPVHARTGLTALGWRRNGDPIWPVMGAAPDDDATDNQQTDGSDDDDQQDQGDDSGGDGAEQLGDAGKKALDRMKQQLRDERKRRKAAEDKAVAAGKKPDDGGDQPDADEIRRQARDEAAAEALKDRVLDKIEAKARKFADSEDAAAILLRGRDVDDFIDGGKVDVGAITEALDELAEAKPHLLARQPGRGDFDTGRGKRSDKGQLTRDDLKKMTQQQIQQARKEGKLDRLMGKPK